MSSVFIRKRSKNYIVYLEYLDKETNKKKQKKMPKDIKFNIKLAIDGKDIVSLWH